MSAARTRPEPVRTLLCDLPLWTAAVVVSVDGALDLRRRLLEMGFCNRAQVTAVRRAPFGDPVEFYLRGYYVSLRRDEARCVTVSVPSAGDGRGEESGARL